MTTRQVLYSNADMMSNIPYMEDGPNLNGFCLRGAGRWNRSGTSVSPATATQPRAKEKERAPLRRWLLSASLLWHLMAVEQPLQFIYEFGPGDRPELATDPGAWTEEDENVFEEHYARLRRATEEGIVILAGRSPDGIGPAIVIFEAESEDAARRFMEGDPFLRHGLFRADLHAFRVALVRTPED